MGYQENLDENYYLKYLSQLSNSCAGKSFPPNAHPSRLGLLLKRGGGVDSIGGSTIQPVARIDGLGLDNLPHDHKGQLMGSDQVIQFMLVPLKLKAPGATGVNGIREVMKRCCKMCLWDGGKFVGNVLSVDVNQSKSNQLQWTFSKDCQLIIRCGDDQRFTQRLHLYIEFNTIYYIQDQEFGDDGCLCKEKEEECYSQVIEITSCWCLISLNGISELFEDCQVECTNRMPKNHIFPLYAGQLKHPPTKLQHLLIASQGKKGFFRQHFSQASEFCVRLIPTDFATSLLNSRIEIRNLPVVCVLSHVMILPVALYRSIVGRELAKAQKPLAKLTHPVLACFPAIMMDDDLRDTFIAQFIYICNKRYKYVGGYPTREWLEPQFVALVEEFWPLIQSQSIMRKHIDNLKHYKDRRRETIERFTKNCVDDVGGVGGGMHKISHDEDMLRVLMIKPFNIEELDFCLTNEMEAPL